jgi:hypothetical protein
VDTCKACNQRIESGTLHSCGAPSFHAPWLEGMLMAANKPLLDELARIRQLLEKEQPKPETKPPSVETKARRRETR